MGTRFRRPAEEVLTSVASEVPDRGSVQVVLDGKTLRGIIPAGQTQGVHLLTAYQINLVPLSRPHDNQNT
jgi:hypothetical protein